MSDPFDAAADPAMPSLALALDPDEVQRRFEEGLPRLAGRDGTVQLAAIRVRRHKPARRCVVEYDVEVRQRDRPPSAFALIGKVRAGRSPRTAYLLQEAFWLGGFGPDSPDGISVPQPVARVKDWLMWLQLKAPGQLATDLLAGPGGAELARRIAEAAHKVHRAGIPAERRHTMADELRILHQCLPVAAEREPRWARRIERLLAACDRLGAATPEPRPCGIHRDFYADQVIVGADGSGRLYLLDLDLYCEGDPALDIGNFLAHITEQSLRTLGDPEALGHVEAAMEERFVELAGSETRVAVRAYALLTLARHVYLSTQFPERRPFTGRVLELCEARLARGAGTD